MTTPISFSAYSMEEGTPGAYVYAALKAGVNPVDLAAVALATLPADDPRRITREDVTREIRAAQQYAGLAKWVEQGQIKVPVSAADFRAMEREHLAMSDKLAALLPPA